ncbi:hypothetical protein [Mesonia aestuariivivens]|uniref:DUF4402 domain-containing protein n=1 Tax=Mesonia aestuariivivens TaxID=2796128 RepID=A0ABS6W1V2_9FLAO|nr:hypothetical protein [Mesonia aestuariivivens]MBW2961833.1 hypothetical protein [Mesonia aestuariivivens]
MRSLFIATCYFTLLFLPLAVKAQIGSAQSQVNLIVRELMSVEIKQSSVMINMNLPSHYKFGNNSGMQHNHIKVTTTSNYVLSVSTTAQNFSYQGLYSSLPVNTVQVEAFLGDLNPYLNASDVTFNSNVSLSSAKVNLLSSHSSETSQSFDVNYTIPTSKVDHFLNIPSGSYKTTVIYTIIPN